MTRPPSAADISVVIPTVGRPILGECLDRIAEGTTWPAAVIVVDQSSSPEIARLVQVARERGLTATHLPSSQRGKSAAVNRGLEQVRTSSVAITDDDCLVERDWLMKMAEYVRMYPGGIVTGPADAIGSERPVSTVTAAAPSVMRRRGLQYELFCGSNMGTSMRTIRKVGSFDEDPCFFAAAEDCEWAYRAVRAGVPIVYRPDVVVHHVGWRSADQRYERYQVYARSHGSFYGKYLRQGDWLIAARVVLHYARALKRWLRGIITADGEQRASGRAYLTGLLPGIVAGMRRGRAV